MRAYWLPDPCGCWSIDSRDSQPSSWACRVRVRARDQSPAHERAPDHSVRLVVPKSHFEFRVLLQVRERPRQTCRASSREYLLSDMSYFLRESVPAADRYSGPG